MPVKFSSSLVAGDAAILGEIVAADFTPGDSRRGFYYTTGEGNRLIVGPTGSGKFQAAIGPMLLTSDATSIILFDVADGEGARNSKAWRSTLGPVFTLDPFKVMGGKRDALNPLDVLHAHDPALITKARKLADAIMMVKKSGGNEDYWNGQAQNFLVALLIHLATSPSEAGRRNLKRAREIIRRPFMPPNGGSEMTAEQFATRYPNLAVLEEMLANPVADGLVRDEADNIIAAEMRGSNNSFYIQQTLRENTSFLDLPEVREATETSTFNIELLRKTVSTLYIIVPEYELDTVSRWLRLVYTVILEKARILPKEGSPAIPLQVIIDEFPALGYFPRVKRDMSQVRKFGMRYHVAVQKLSQLKGLYGDDWEGFAPTYLHILGADEQFTAEYVSKRLGDRAKPSTSETVSRSQSGGSQSTSKNYYTGPMMAPHEISQMPRDRCLVLVEGEEPLNLRKIFLYNTPALKERRDFTGGK